jgi:transcriptional regulator with XRE-family HTH domain
MTMRHDSSINYAFGERVYQLRALRNWSQAEMAQQADLDRSFISDLECGKKSPAFFTIYKIAKGFGISLSELLEGL